jgi:glycosyltransferase involved in cell wall biosynthesis
MTLSRIAPEKGQEELLKALKIGEERGQIPAGLTVAIVGAPSYMMGQRYLEKLKKLAGQLRRVRILFPGHLGGPEKRAALEMARLFVVCSRHESYGLTIMEAMAAGLPIIARRSYGVEATVDASCGTVLEGGGDFAGRLWSQVETHLSHPEAARAMGQAGAARASQATFQEAADRLRQLCQGSHQVLA